ncbi:MAG: hypothetical protein ABSC17_09645 [Thermacetogeniaceae bacterium]
MKRSEVIKWLTVLKDEMTKASNGGQAEYDLLPDALASHSHELGLPEFTQYIAALEAAVNIIALETEHDPKADEACKDNNK